MTFPSAVSQLAPEQIPALASARLRSLDPLFYAVAAWAGYVLALRRARTSEPGPGASSGAPAPGVDRRTGP